MCHLDDHIIVCLHCLFKLLFDYMLSVFYLSIVFMIIYNMHYVMYNILCEMLRLI